MPRMRGSITFSVLLVLCACKTPVAGPGSQGDGVSAIQFQDMAVPEGLTLRDDNHQSYSSEESGWRQGHFEYSGQARLEDACGHVLQRMPQHSWVRVADEQPDESTRILKFTRGRYTAEYNLRRQDGITYMVIDYRTDIQTR